VSRYVVGRGDCSADNGGLLMGDARKTAVWSDNTWQPQD